MSWSLASFDPGEDWSLFDGVENATYARFQPGTVGSGTKDAYQTGITVRALFREIAESGTPIIEGEATMREVRIHIPAVDLVQSLVPFLPHKRDKISRGDGRTYYVQEDGEATLGTRFRLTCTKGAA